MKDIKYLGAFSIPVMAFVGLYLKGSFSFITPLYAFVLLPILETILPLNNSNYTRESLKERQHKKIFDWLLYLNLPIVYSLLAITLYTISTTSFKTHELIGVIISTGIVLGVNGINVAHELGHRQDSNERFIGKALLLPSFYMHFYIEHNFGHHLHAATKEDPATALYNQSVYSFWITSVFRQYIKAWNIQLKLLNNNNQGFLSLKNDMFWFVVFQLAYLITIFLLFSQIGLLVAVCSGIVGFLLLETVNYIEHYGLLRLKTKSGRYERVGEIHSWNSNHVIGRIVLYELTRHSDHHYKTSKKYQVLECHDASPQMPFGYPTSMMISLLPPLWFHIMNKRIPKEMIPI